GGKRPQAFPHHRLEHRPAGEERRDAARLARYPSELTERGDLPAEVDLECAALPHGAVEAGKETLQLVPPARQERVHVTALWHAGAVGRRGGVAVAVDHRHAVEEAAEDSSRAPPREASPR